MKILKPEKSIAPRNRTIRLSDAEIQASRFHFKRFFEPVAAERLNNSILHQDIFHALPHLPKNFVDLLFIDPPYNLSRNYNGYNFREMGVEEYARWFTSWFDPLLKTVKPCASVYVCTDWKHSSIIHEILSSRMIVRNRITWEREKGRGSRNNWKNNTEDIWFATMADCYTFNVEDVKLKRNVIAPYRDREGNPRDWIEQEGGNFRITYPSNIWTDLTIPFWSMPENTDHPTQKPEKLLARVILASSNSGDMVLDPFGGSGTTAVVASKLGRNYCIVERDLEYCALTYHRLQRSIEDTCIQGYDGKYFLDRNSGKLK